MRCANIRENMSYIFTAMTATQNIQLYQILQEHFGKNENAAKAVSAIEAIVEQKVDTGNKRYEELLHKDIDTLRSEMDKKIEGVKSDLSRTIYIVGLVQFLAIVGSVLGILSFMLRH